MNFKFAVAAVLAASSMSAMAADQTIVLNATGPTHFDGINTLFEGNSDLLTFVGLTPGKYNVAISLSGTDVSFNGDLTTLNGLNATQYVGGSPRFAFLGVEATANSPFVLDLFGSVKNVTSGAYYGQISFTSVSAVPEPTTYGMLLGGLGIMGFLARRKSKQA